MIFQKNISLIIGGLSWVMLLTACGNDKSPTSLSDETPDTLTFEERNDRPKMATKIDNTKVARNWDEYTYLIEIEENPEARAVNVKQTSNKKSNEKKSVENKNTLSGNDGVNATDVPQKLEASEIDQFNIERELSQLEIEIDLNAVVKDLELNRPPLFDPSCLNAAYPVKCSNEKIQEYIKEKLDYPQSAIPDDYEGVEIVSVRVNKKGEVEPGVSILTENSPCQGCAKAAAAIVAQMPDNWAPALKNGEAVNTRINIPIRFEHRGNTSLK